MRIKCIDNYGQEAALTVGKIYLAETYVDQENYEYYRLIKTDTRDSGGYLKERFIEFTIQDERKEKLLKLKNVK